MRNGLALAVICLVTAGMGTAIGNDALGKTANIKLGYWVAERCLDALNLYRNLNLAENKPAACVDADYNEDEGVIVVSLYGIQTTAEAAQSGIAVWWKWLDGVHIPMMQAQFGLTLGVNDYTIIYYNWKPSGVGREVIRREKGKFVLPKG